MVVRDVAWLSRRQYAWNFLALIVFFALKLFKALIRVKTCKQCTRYVFAGFLLHISYQDTFIWCMECWIQSVVCNGPRTFVLFLLCNFAVVLLALEVLAMYLFQTITALTIMNRVLNFLGHIVFFASKLSHKVKAWKQASRYYFCNSNWCQVNAKNKFSRGNSDRGFFMSDPIDLSSNRISITNCRTAKANCWISKALIRLKHTNNALDMFLPGSCYTSHIKTLLSVLSGLWSVGFCQSSATDREYFSYSCYATLPSYDWPWKCLRCIFFRFHNCKYIVYFTFLYDYVYLIHVNVQVQVNSQQRIGAH